MPTSHAIEERFAVELSATWKQWFDLESQSLELPGPFSQPIAADDLLLPAPTSIWPGMMLPNSLPLLSNGYGDWLCVTVTESGNLGELVHWYHGGGDWIPVGNCVQVAALHDCIDCLRPKSPQMLRSAIESSPRLAIDQMEAKLGSASLTKWLLQVPGFNSEATNEFCNLLGDNNYPGLIDWAQKHGVAPEAVACDRIEQLLQPAGFEDRLIELGITSSATNKAEHTRIAFDPAYFGSADDASIAQDWDQAEQIASEVLSYRQDLAWAFDIAGWAAQRRGKSEKAVEVFCSGQMASAFSSQAVRLKSHFGGFEHNKFCVDRLLEGSTEASAYARLWQQESMTSVLQAVQNYWIEKAESALRQDRPDAAYSSYFSAGWDIGFGSLKDCIKILEGLVRSSELAGWEALSRVASTHLACLAGRLNRK